MHQRADEHGAIADRRDVANEDTAEACSESGCVVANLVGVREDEVIRRLGADELFESGSKSVGSVLCQQRMFDSGDFGHALCSGFLRKGLGLCADDDGIGF